MIGRSLLHYEIVARLGAGGMGEVYRAHDTRLGRDVALKILPPDVAADPARLARFEREARTVAGLNHPHIVHLYSVEEADDVRFITMELVEGRGLERLLANGALPPAQVVEIGAAVADALAAAHAKGVVHRDLKPANVMISDDGRVKVLDFGLAKVGVPTDGSGASSPKSSSADETITQLVPLTMDGSVLGTMPYMSPEQVRGREVDHLSDIFSLGVLLHELATGSRPFTGETGPDVTSAILRDHPPRVTELKADLPPHLDLVVARCLEKEPGHRFASAALVRDELKGLASAVESRERRVSGEAQDAPAATAAPAGQATRRRGRPLLLAVAALAVVAAALAIWRSGEREAPGAATGDEPIRALAVLPLANLSGDPGQDYFVDGITDALINELSRLDGLRVISRTSVMQYRNAARPLGEIAAELGVDAVLEGSVVRAGNRLDITAQLIDADTERRLWGRSYERDLKDVLSLRKEVARAVADGIALSLTPADEARFARTREVDPAAYEYYLRGLDDFSRYTPEAFDAAIDFYTKAVAADPRFAAAHTGLAKVYAMASVFGFRAPAESIPLAKAAVREALALDPDDADALAMQSYITHAYDWRWDEAESQYRRALAVNPNNSLTHYLAALSHLSRREFDASVAAFERARRLDPMNPMVYLEVGWALYYARDYAAAIADLERTRELFPDFFDIYYHLGQCREQLGQHDQAIALLRRAVELEPGPVPPRTGLAHALALSGRPDEAREILAGLVAEYQHRYVPPVLIAFGYAGLGDADAVAFWLERGWEARDVWMTLIGVDPGWDPVRDDPRFQEFVGRMAFPAS